MTRLRLFSLSTQQLLPRGNKMKKMKNQEADHHLRAGVRNGSWRDKESDFRGTKQGHWFHSAL